MSQIERGVAKTMHMVNLIKYLSPARRFLGSDSAGLLFPYNLHGTHWVLVSAKCTMRSVAGNAVDGNVKRRDGGKETLEITDLVYYDSCADSVQLSLINLEN